jgi:hypothetical protein
MGIHVDDQEIVELARIGLLARMGENPGGVVFINRECVLNATRWKFHPPLPVTSPLLASLSFHWGRMDGPVKPGHDDKTKFQNVMTSSVLRFNTPLFRHGPA